MKVGAPQPIDHAQRQSQGKTESPAQKAATEGLSPGSHLRGKVVSVDGSGRYLVETEAGSFRAKSFIPLEIGKNFWFEVIEGRGKPLLAAAAQKNAIIDILQQFLPGMRQFSGQQEELLRAGAASPGARQFVQLLADNATGPEPDLAKLLRLLMLVKGKAGRAAVTAGDGQPGRQAGPAGYDDRELYAFMQKGGAPVIRKLVKLFDAHQVLNRSQGAATSPAHNNDFYLFPCFFAGDSGFGEWLFSFGRQDESSEEAAKQPGQRISFYLVMSELGDLHLDLTLRDKSVQGAFSLASPEAASHLQEKLPMLEECLKQFCESVSLSCSHSRLSTLQRIKDDLSTRAGMRDFVLLDVTA